MIVGAWIEHGKGKRFDDWWTCAADVDVRANDHEAAPRAATGGSPRSSKPMSGVSVATLRRKDTDARMAPLHLPRQASAGLSDAVTQHRLRQGVGACRPPIS